MDPLLEKSGVQITLVLLLLVIIGALVVAIVKTYVLYIDLVRKKELGEDGELINAEQKEGLPFDFSPDVPSMLPDPLQMPPQNVLLKNVNTVGEIRVFPTKKSRNLSQTVSPELGKLILWFMGTSLFWLVLGTTVGLYVGIKFVIPDIEQVEWLSFGRLRPVHTNMVFWGWASLAMVGLAYYVVPRVSNKENFNLAQGYTSMVLMNIAVLAGSIFIMAGINNGGGEYREYIWPVMLTFGVGVALSAHNFFRPIIHRKTEEIYISNWYIAASAVFIVIVIVISYLPFYQNGVGETIIQGYYMHMAIGMWFMFLTLGLMYYFLPQQLNKPIYSYSLGILGFWTHILFYTLIGTHHFIFSAIPWRLQTTAIVASAGMVIPVAAGTANFLLTFKGAWHKLKTSYTLPFYFLGIIFYFTGSFQGTVEAFRYTNLLWHFTDFTVAHSHLTMYGIITFMLWGFSYTMIPRITGKEPPKLLVGFHFWFALIGLLFYVIALMIGGTRTGMIWMDKKPFIDGVMSMAPFWLWRAIGGTMMWLSHIIYAYNFYKMVAQKKPIEVKNSPAGILQAKRESYNKEF